MIGLRFRLDGVPAFGEIVSAYVRLAGYGNDDPIMSLVASATPEDDAKPFSSDFEPYQVSRYGRTFVFFFFF